MHLAWPIGIDTQARYASANHLCPATARTSDEDAARTIRGFTGYESYDKTQGLLEVGE